MSSNVSELARGFVDLRHRLRLDSIQRANQASFINEMRQRSMMRLDIEVAVESKQTLQSHRECDWKRHMCGSHD